VSLRFLHAFATLALFTTSCLSMPPSNENEPSEQAKLRESIETLNANLQKHRNTLREDIREIILEEILPEIWTKNNEAIKSINAAQSKAARDSKQLPTIGRVEWLGFNDPNFEIQARIDTGAQTCSLHAENIKERQINGEQFVQFETLDKNDERHTMVRRVVTTSRVRNTAGTTTKRYVIREQVKIGGKIHEVNVNLNDRSELRYKFLAGRNLLIGNFIVDVSESHLLGDKL